MYVKLYVNFSKFYVFYYMLTCKCRLVCWVFNCFLFFILQLWHIVYDNEMKIASSHNILWLDLNVKLWKIRPILLAHLWAQAQPTIQFKTWEYGGGECRGEMECRSEQWWRGERAGRNNSETTILSAWWAYLFNCF